MNHTSTNDKCFGSLIGGAIGDALGYAVEFSFYNEIIDQFGPKGITRFVTDSTGTARFSDDTQMTLFTLEGLVSGAIETDFGDIRELLPFIRKAYVDWYRTQTGSPRPLPGSWLSDIRRLWKRRAPGHTCMSALRSIAEGHEVNNDSKGCGGVMRVAPIGIFGARQHSRYSSDDIAILAGEAAALTHLNIASTWASALAALVVRDCILTQSVNADEFEDIVRKALEKSVTLFDGPSHIREAFSGLIERTFELAKSGQTDVEAIESLGEGWTADEAIAIAIYCTARHIDSFEDCVIAAVNHDGDSDSTGAIAGNIIGAILGLHAIPEYFLKQLELRPLLQIAAANLTSLR